MRDPTPSQNSTDLRRQQEFVGREEELTAFQEFLNRTPGEARNRLIINLVGDGGVGKTWLMRQMQQAADQRGVLTAYADEAQINLAAVMDHIASQLERRGLKLKSFRERHKAYLQSINQIEADPQAPQGLADMLGRMALRAAFVAGDLVPGLRIGLEFLPKDQLEAQAGEWLNFLVKKLTNKDEVRLVLEPIQVLTPLFLEDLHKIIARRTRILFFLDTYEKTGEYLDDWLRDLLGGKYGAWLGDIRLVIAGREGLNRSQWTDFLSLVDFRDLSPFSEAEAQIYLSQKGITDARVVQVILQLSQRLPLLVATLATESPKEVDKVGEPSGDAIERFLKWVEDPQRREVALSASLPRGINKDVLAVLVGEEQSGPMFDWLRDMPFVEMGREGWTYHEIVRTLMLRYKRRESPRGWIDLHGRLAEYYEGLLANQGLEAAAAFEDARGQKEAMEAGYHRLCQAYPRNKDGVLNDFVRAVLTQTTFAHAWAGMIAQAERDLEVEAEDSWGRRLAEGLQAFDEKRYQEAAQMFTTLLERAALEPIWRAAALARRGLTYRLMGNYPAAIQDLNAAIELNPKDVWALVQRGEAYRQQGEVDRALADYDRAIQLEGGNTWAIVLKGETYRQAGRFEQALAEFQKATRLDPENAWAMVLQSETYRQMGRYPEALAGFDRAVALAPDYAYAITHRGEAYRQMGQVEKAVEDFDRALELDPDFTWAWVLRGEARRQVGQFEAAVEDFNRAIELDPQDAWPIALRGEAQRQSGHIQQALADYDRAIALKPDYSWAITLRGETRRQMGNFQEALDDFDRALQNEPENVWTLTLRGETQRQLGNNEAALADFNRALEIEPANSWVLTFRSQTYRQMGHYEQALADCTHALEIRPDYAWPAAQRGETYRQMGRFEEALADLSRAIELDPGDSWALARRAEAYRQMERYTESQLDFNRALALNPKDDWARERRQHLYEALEFHQGAWRAVYTDQLLEVYYEGEGHKSQYAALHLNDSYFRMVYGPDSGWGTSLILLPVFWSQQKLYQSGPVAAQPRVEGADLILDVLGDIAELRVACQVRINPPGETAILAQVKVQVTGEVDLDERPAEAFKAVMLSSMHVSPEVWDAQYAYAGRRPHGIPQSGWIIQPPETETRFGLRGGTSTWKENAPSVIVQLDRPLKIAGWVTASEDANDDNVGLWAASEVLLTEWEYSIQVMRA